jgi:hypothetical protein
MAATLLFRDWAVSAMLTTEDGELARISSSGADHLNPRDPSRGIEFA